jgi:UDP-N-acetylmuramoyl-L-alanyl-D-glutamate--2,6-diaminopimelate ligase
MPRKRLSTLLGRIDTREIRGSADPSIDAICYDSRSVTPGSLFVATRGFHVDGHSYVDDAVARGAAAVVVERVEAAEGVPQACPVAVVENARIALSAMAAAFYDDPSAELFVIGITGTDGKSSTVSFTEQILTAAGIDTGLISTVTVKTDREIFKNPQRQSTPEAVELHRYLAEMRDNGKRIAVVEATSHGLSLRTARLADVRFDAAVFTNLSHEHLEFHGSFEQYRSDKANLFRALDSGGDDAFGVVNACDENAAYMAEQTGSPVLSYGVVAEGGGHTAHVPNGGRGSLDLVATEVHPEPGATAFTLVDRDGTRRPLRIPMPGTFQVENVLAALLVASTAIGRSALELADAVEHLEPVEGRLVPVGRTAPFAVIVDYAHTPNSYEKLFPIIRASTPGRIIAVFGSAGERDIEKRPLQGAVAARHCELVVLCDEDPRGEDPRAILEEIAAGVREADPNRREGEGYLIIEDRRRAIRAAVDAAEPGDTIILLGKGHETNIIYADGPRPWNEADVAYEVLVEAGYEHPRQEAPT